ncbi:family 16 glycosylhydrolase [Methylobacterium sp. WL8]|uniref:family 16 glycosylhydrolase n=2 Tax=unclassified Methylobacterium TaxID=2615210 RepID=UPI0011CC9A44|nr:family 16 glycosylhydrolase [Methylobacterium sp. WL8]TXM97293.1 glycoside hydrolase family 16 protein [Methylobacterium sp. WL122]TXN75668.1 glycoside hydrolase family 16 protein [Methylobacterium sp. WL8]
MAIDPNNLSQTATLTFAEEFDAFDTWNGTTGLDTVGAPQWSTKIRATGTMPYNDESQYYVAGADGAAGAGNSLPNPFHVADGALTIFAAPAAPDIQGSLEGQAYTSGMINTYHEFSQTYGYFEMRAELPAGHGLWPAFWMLPEDGSWPPELDVMEMIGSEPTTLRNTVHSQVSGDQKVDATHYLNEANVTVSDMTSGFHTYGVDWEPDTITWYYDGQPTFQAATPADLDKPMYLIANLAVGGAWAGDPDATTPVPAQMTIDYIHAYASAPASSALTDTFHFRDAGTGDDLYTTSPSERQYIAQNLPSYTEEGVAWMAPAPSADTVDVFRFVDTRTGEHFYTASIAERNHIDAMMPSFHDEGVAFQAYADPALAGADALTVQRFLDTATGDHHYTAGDAETAAFEQAQTGANWVHEGVAFTVHTPVTGTLDY